MPGTVKKSKSNKKDINQQLYNTIYTKVTAENYQENQDETAKECKRLFKQGASPETLAKLEEILRERQNEQTLAKHIDPSKQKNGPKTPDELKESLKKQREDYEYYIQHFLPALLGKITQSTKLDKEKAKEIGRIISEIISKSKDESRSSVETAEQSTTSGSDSDSGRSSLTLVTSTSSEESVNSTSSSAGEGNDPVLSEQIAEKKPQVQENENSDGQANPDQVKNEVSPGIIQVADTGIQREKNTDSSGQATQVTSNQGKDPMRHEEKKDRKNATTPVQKLPVNEKKDEDIPLKQPNNRNFHVVLVAGCALSTIGCIVAGVMTSGLVGAGLLAMAAVFAIAAVAELHSNFLSSKLTSISVEPHVNDKELTACSHL